MTMDSSPTPVTQPTATSVYQCARSSIRDCPYRVLLFPKRPICNRSRRRQRRRAPGSILRPHRPALKVNGRSNRSAGSAAKRGNSEEIAKIREWANANGHEISSRGRNSQAVREPTMSHTDAAPPTEQPATPAVAGCFRSRRYGALMSVRAHLA